VSLNEETIQPLMDIALDPATNTLTIDLPHQVVIAADRQRLDFEIEPARKEALLLGLDAIGTTLQFRDEIVSFEKEHLDRNPWLT
jgi:3-isopropylmalate/(R)-2-methylmalate dehydratase small subunit